LENLLPATINQKNNFAKAAEHFKETDLIFKVLNYDSDFNSTFLTQSL